MLLLLCCDGLSICHNFVSKHQNYSTNHVLLSNDSSMWGIHTIHCYFLLGLPCDFMSILGGSFWSLLAFWKLNYFGSRHHMTHDAIQYLPPCIVHISLEQNDGESSSKSLTFLLLLFQRAFRCMNHEWYGWNECCHFSSNSTLGI